MLKTTEEQKFREKKSQKKQMYTANFVSLVWRINQNLKFISFPVLNHRLKTIWDKNLVDRMQSKTKQQQ